MSNQPFRNSTGGAIDRSRPLAFTFDGRRYQGFAGDTLASALLANGVRLVGRSFKYHRPRGVFSAGPEEPSAVVEVGVGARREPNTRATMVELFDGLVARSQNRWPSAEWDLGALTGLFGRFLPAGFYYKTFMWPGRKGWHFYEKVIRRAAGLGRAPEAPDPDRYDKRHVHCDVLVAGGGPAGLAAALAAGRAGADVVLADEREAFGGMLLTEPGEIDRRPAGEWVAAAADELAAMPAVTLLPRTTVFGYYDRDLLGAVERLSGHGPEATAPRQRLWKIRARRVILATGAIERPLVFHGNDRPGVMLASAARTYANRYAVRPGRRAVIFTNNDSAYGAARDLDAAGVGIAALVDVRLAPGRAALAAAESAGIPCRTGAVVVAAHGGRRGLRMVDIAALAPDGGSVAGEPERIACDLLCVSGGWSPTVHLHAQARGRPEWDAELAAFVPGKAALDETSVGAAAGRFELAACLRDGLREGARAARAAGFGNGKAPAAPKAAGESPGRVHAFWSVPHAGRGGDKRFVDIQDDVTDADVALAAREGFRSVEHAKRYTTLGMGTDQGKTSNVNGLAILARVLGNDIPSTGTTTFRPPYTPVTIGAIAGREGHERLAPLRRSPLHGWHERHGAVFLPAGLWLRPKFYPREGESQFDAAMREARAVREGVGMVDVSTLGKIDLQGPDTVELLNRVYINGWKTLQVGHARYGVMLREDGIVYDDGTTSRLGETHYHMTTTTAHAASVMAHIEFLLQVVWPDLRVRAVSVTDQWAGMALAGPKSRDVLAAIVDDMDVRDDALPFMGVAVGRIAGLPARVFRISFSGELGYEINVPADYGEAVWEAVMEAGETFGIVPYGTEAMDIMRVEKGHVTGGEIDGRTTPMDLGFGRMVSTRKDFIGRALLDRAAFRDPDRPRLAGLLPVDGRTPIPAGAALAAGPGAQSQQPILGRVTSAQHSPTLDSPVALGLVQGGADRGDAPLWALSPLTGEECRVRVVSPVFFDPEGKRLRG